MNNYINVFLRDFGNLKGNEIVTENPDGGYTILINSRLCTEKRIDAYTHAMRHINERDFEKADVQAIETDAHRKEGV